MDVIFYGAAVSACRPPLAWRAALQLFGDAKASGAHVTEQLLGAVVAVCSRAQRWQLALELFLAEPGGKNAVMATALLRYVPAERVEALLGAAQSMKVRLDTIAYNVPRGQRCRCKHKHTVLYCYMHTLLYYHVYYPI